jgi:hypothetical protein
MLGKVAENQNPSRLLYIIFISLHLRELRQLLISAHIESQPLLLRSCRPSTAHFRCAEMAQRVGMRMTNLTADFEYAYTD